MANRLKGVLPELISDSQSAFVPDRLITDNILMAFEAHHYIKNKKVGKLGYMSIKLDMEKAYDRVEWTYLRFVMNRLAFPFPGSIFCEGLSASIEEAVTEKYLQGLKIRRQSEPITSLLFVDDSLLFGQATVAEAAVFRSILLNYEHASGQRINLSKSVIQFSPNVDSQLRMEISNILNISETVSHGKYLGLPSAVGKSKVEIFSGLSTKVKQKLTSWSSKNLSKAGKEVIIKSTIQASPCYTMQVFKIPNTICDTINSLAASYFWGSTTTDMKIHWLSWHKLCQPNEEGGLGFREMRAYNLALLCKQAWRLVTQLSSPVSVLFKSIYYPHCSFWEAEMGSKPSLNWRSIMEAKHLLLKGCVWQVGDGSSIRIWTDSWLKHTHSGRPTTPQPSSNTYNTVSELIDQVNGTWNLPLLITLFYQVDIEAILQIPLLNTSQPDQVSWKYEVQGDFTVKSAYLLYLRELHPDAQEQSSSSNLAIQQLYSRIWKLPVPPKVKHFLWRCTTNSLPTICNLHQRRLDISLKCYLCNGEIESEAAHLFHYCSFTKEVCGLLGISVLLPSPATMHTIITELFVSLSRTQFIRWVVGIWDIWWQRNQFIQGKTIRQPPEVVEFVDYFIAKEGSASERLKMAALEENGE